MTQHDHSEYMPGCYRCELGRDEAMHAVATERDELEAESDRLREALREAISWSYGVDVTPERRDEVERLVR